MTEPQRDKPALNLTKDTIGVVMAVFKPHLVYYRQQLESIQSQSYRNLLCLVTVNTEEKEKISFHELQKFTSEVLQDDPRFVLVENHVAQGIKENFSFGVEQLFKIHPTIQYLSFSDQDDVWHSNKLETKLRLLKTKPLGSLVHCDMQVVDSDGSIISESCWRTEKRDIDAVSLPDLIVRNIIAGAGLLMDSSLWRENPTIPQAIPFHDHWAAILASNQGGVYPLHQPLYDYRVHHQSTLGVSPFKGVFYNALAGNSLEVSRQKWLQASERARAVWAFGQCKDIAEIGLFIRSYDFGFGLFYWAVRCYLRGQRATARSLLALAFGKLFFLGKLGRVQKSSPTAFLSQNDLPNYKNTEAVVVLFNPTQDQIARLKNEYSKFFLKIILIDNTPDSELKSLLDPLKFEVIHLGNQGGLAAALACGYSKFMTDNQGRWLLTLDQDSKLDENFYKVLEKSFKDFLDTSNEYRIERALYSLNYREAHSNLVAVAPKSHVKGFFEQKTLISSGTLLHREVLETIGSPIKELFIDGIDHDLSLRAKRAGLASYISLQPAMTHALGHTKHHKLLFTTCTTSNHPPFRWIFFWRNWGRVFAENFPYSLFWGLSSGWMLTKWLMKHLIFSSKRQEIAFNSLRGIFRIPGFVLNMFCDRNFLRSIPSSIVNQLKIKEDDITGSLPDELTKEAKTFCFKLVAELRASPFWQNEFRIDHVCYRVSSQDRYRELTTKMHQYGKLLSEALVNGRPISTFKLRKPLKIAKDTFIDLIEIPSPKPGKNYVEGFEHIEAAIHTDLKLFVEKHQSASFDLSNLAAQINPDVSIRFQNGLVKFHEMTLERVIIEEDC